METLQVVERFMELIVKKRSEFDPSELQLSSVSQSVIRQTAFFVAKKNRLL